MRTVDCTLKMRVHINQIEAAEAEAEETNSDFSSDLRSQSKISCVKSIMRTHNVRHNKYV
jgi:hypothetical protein